MVMFLKALAPMLVTSLLLVGIVVDWQLAINVFEEVSTIQLLLGDLYFVLFASTVIMVKPLQPLNAVDAMLLTLLGISIEVRPLQPLNALALMLVMLLGMVMEVKELMSLKALAPMLVTVLSVGIVVVLHPAINVFEDL